MEHCAIFGAFAAVLPQVHVFYDDNPCLMVNFYEQEILLGLLDTEAEILVVLQNVGGSLQVDTV